MATDAFLRDGLTVVLPGDRWHLSPVQTVERPADAGPVDLVLVCVKSYDTAAAASVSRPGV